MVRQLFVGALALILLFGLVILPLVGIMATDVPEEDFKRDVRKGL